VIESRFKLKEKLVNDIIEGLVYSPESISQRCSELGIHFSEYYVMVYEMEDHKPADSGNKDGGVFTSSIINLLSTSFKDFQHIIVPVRSYCLCSVVSFSEASARECQQTILEVSREILSTVEGFMGFSLSIGISGKHASLTELYGAYREAVQALDEKFFNNAESCISIFSQCSKNMSSEEKGMTNQYLESILHAVKEGNRDISASMVKELLEKLRMGKLPIDLIKNICIHLCSSLETLLYNYNMNLSDCIPNENGIYGNILEAQSIRGLSDILINITNAVSFRLSELEHQNNYIIKKVTGYIYENYRSDIKLKTLADFVHISSSYLSRMFRKETGDTITDTISKIRMEKAKELIRNSGMKTYEVACAVGINDAAYFSVLFKKYAGVSPKDYKYLDPE
jgi:two-component system response regulator YesN